MTSCPPLMRNRMLCWQDDNDALVDHTNPAGVVEHCLDRTRALLDHALHERPWPDIMAEHATYWSQHSDAQVLAEAPRVTSPTAMAWTGDVLRVLRPAANGRDAVLVPLQQGRLPLPPDGDMTVDQVRKHLLSLASPETRIDFFRERGGADLRLKTAKVLVVGCGSVGGAIAQDLARSGRHHHRRRPGPRAARPVGL